MSLIALLPSPIGTTGYFAGRFLHVLIVIHASLSTNKFSINVSLDKLTSTKENITQRKAKRSYAWLLPVGLIIGFLAIFALLFGERLLPAIEVKTAPVVTLRASSPTKNTAEKTPIKIEKNTLAKGSMIFQASGWVEPDPYITYVPTLVNGVVKTVEVLEGQSVKQGDLLATLIDDDAKLDLQQATRKHESMEKAIIAHCTQSDIVKAEQKATEKKVTAAQAQLAESSDNYSRLARLPNGAVPRQQVVQAQLTVKKHAAIVEQAKAELPRLQARLDQIEAERIAMQAELKSLGIERDRAKLALDRTRITATSDGIILHLHAAPGKKRMLDMDDSKSAVIVEMYQPEHLQARIDVPLNEAAQLIPGQAVELVSDLLPDVIFEGRVTRIVGEADLQRNTLQAKVAIKNPDPRLRPEMLVRAKFFSTGNQQANTSHNRSKQSSRLKIYVPEEAVINQNLVWVVSSNNKAVSRTIKLGKESKDGHLIVLEGLKSGEHVILPPHDKLKDGVRINPTAKK